MPSNSANCPQAATKSVSRRSRFSIRMTVKQSIQKRLSITGRPSLDVSQPKSSSARSIKTKMALSVLKNLSPSGKL